MARISSSDALKEMARPLVVIVPNESLQGPADPDVENPCRTRQFHGPPASRVPRPESTSFQTTLTPLTIMFRPWIFVIGALPPAHRRVVLADFHRHQVRSRADPVEVPRNPADLVMDVIHTTLGALVAGLVTSVHCVGMCGPIACGLSAMPASESERMLAATAYHGTRLTSYAVIGAICGAVGRQPLQWIFNSPAVILPWMLVGVFLVFAFGLEKRLPRPAGIVEITRPRVAVQDLAAHADPQRPGAWGSDAVAALRAALSVVRRGPAQRFRLARRGVRARLRAGHGAAVMARADPAPPDQNGGSRRWRWSGSSADWL